MASTLKAKQSLMTLGGPIPAPTRQLLRDCNVPKFIPVSQEGLQAAVDAARPELCIMVDLLHPPKFDERYTRPVYFLISGDREAAEASRTVPYRVAGSDEAGQLAGIPPTDRIVPWLPPTDGVAQLTDPDTFRKQFIGLLEKWQPKETNDRNADRAIAWGLSAAANGGNAPAGDGRVDPDRPGPDGGAGVEP